MAFAGELFSDPSERHRESSSSNDPVSRGCRGNGHGSRDVSRSPDRMTGGDRASPESDRFVERQLWDTLWAGAPTRLASSRSSADDERIPMCAACRCFRSTAESGMRPSKPACPEYRRLLSIDHRYFDAGCRMKLRSLRHIFNIRPRKVRLKNTYLRIV